jgi:hypothetical protein
MTASLSNDSLSRTAPASTVGTSVAASSASAVAPAPVPTKTAPNAVRARAVRLIREAVAAGNSHGNANTTSGAALSSGEVAFAVEEAAMTAFGAGHPRYYEFVTRLAFSFKVRLYQQFVVLCCVELRPALSWCALCRTVPPWPRCWTRSGAAASRTAWNWCPVNLALCVLRCCIDGHFSIFEKCEPYG